MGAPKGNAAAYGGVGWIDSQPVYHAIVTYLRLSELATILGYRRYSQNLSTVYGRPTALSTVVSDVRVLQVGRCRCGCLVMRAHVQEERGACAGVARRWRTVGNSALERIRARRVRARPRSVASPARAILRERIRWADPQPTAEPSPPCATRCVSPVQLDVASSCELMRAVCVGHSQFPLGRQPSRRQAVGPCTGTQAND